MYRSAYDLKSFYNTKVGRMVRRILQERIREPGRTPSACACWAAVTRRLIYACSWKRANVFWRRCPPGRARTIGRTIIPATIIASSAFPKKQSYL